MTLATFALLALLCILGSVTAALLHRATRETGPSSECVQDECTQDADPLDGPFCADHNWTTYLRSAFGERLNGGQDG